MKPGYKQTEAGVIPADWDVHSLKDGTDPKRPISYGIVQTGPSVLGGVRCLRVVDISRGRVNDIDLITTSQEVSNAYKRTILREGDLVMPLRGKVGEVALIDAKLSGCNLTRGVALVALRGSWSAPYLKQFVASSGACGRLEQSMNGSALQEIPIATLREFRVAIPPTKKEQNAIAEALSDADALIESLEQLLAKKRDLKQGAMQELLTGKKRLLGRHKADARCKHTEIGTIPEDWDVSTIGKLATTSSGTTPPRAMAERYFHNGTIPWVKTLDLNNSSIRSVDEMVTPAALAETSLQLYPPGSVLVAMYGGHNQIGRTGLLMKPATVNQALTAIRPEGQRLNSEYLLRVLNYNVEYWRSVASSSRKDPNITGKDVQQFPLAVPPLAEQAAIATILANMDAEITVLESKLTKARQIKQGMMQELLTGRIRLT
jgi:type I restriction enzyme S subunit